jgi:MerR family transcriptional regulator, thiopeptide resistance regulator
MSTATVRDVTDSEREWTIGELARVAGVSARTLRHYDHVGLLAPSARSVGGRRCYGVAEVERLYRILALRSLGVSLETIADVLATDEPGRLIEIVRMQRLRAERQLELASQRLSPRTPTMDQITPTTAVAGWGR